MSRTGDVGSDDGASLTAPALTSIESTTAATAIAATTPRCATSAPPEPTATANEVTSGGRFRLRRC